MRFVAVGAGAVLGANLRFIVANWAADRWGVDFPYGTFLINVSGAFIIGLFFAVVAERTGLNPLWRLFFVTGFVGGYTTFSTYMYEALMLGQDSAWLRFGIYVVGSTVLGLTGVWLGSKIGSLAA
ncbi:MAG: fluoride efflux transporter CrcB [Chloroflexota bacterium]